MTRVAEEMGVQGEALRAGLIGQLLAALLEKETGDDPVKGESGRGAVG